jgi:electron transfer flavoprotein beta subunit
VDGATAYVRLTLPGVVTVIDKIVHPRSVRSMATPATHTYQDGVRFAALMAIMAAKKKPLTEMTLADLVADLTLKVRYDGVELPAKRGAGVKVKSARELVAKLRTEAKVV